MRHTGGNLHGLQRRRPQNPRLPNGLSDQTTGPLRAAIVREQITRHHDHRTGTQRILCNLKLSRPKPRALAPRPRVKMISRYVIDDAEDGPALLKQADADGEISQTGDKIVGSIDGIDDPDATIGIGTFEGYRL